MIAKTTLSKTNFAYQQWIRVGYHQFSLNGVEGILVERLARILNLNKSGFYYYFGDREYYLEQLLKYHLAQFTEVADEMRRMTRFDPDYFTIVMKHQPAFTMHLQLLRYRHLPLCQRYYDEANRIVEKEILPAWAVFIGIPDEPALALRLYGHARDVVHARLTPEGIHHEEIRNLMHEVKGITQQLIDIRYPQAFP